MSIFNRARAFAALVAIAIAVFGSVLALAGGSAQAQTPTTATTSPTPTSSASPVASTSPTSSATATATTAVPTTAVPTTAVPTTAVPTTAVPTTAVPTTPAAATQPANAPINLTLAGANEVPPVTSTGTGKFLGTASSSALAFTLTAGGTATNITMAHIHMGACGTNGPVVAFFYNNAAGASSINVSGTVTAANLVGPLQGKTMQDLLDLINAGQTYVNVHTVANPAGELRACIPAAPKAPATGNAGASADGSNVTLFAALAGLAGLFIVSGGAAVAIRRRS